MTTQDENRDSVHASAYSPFPEPRTIPSGWDTSGLHSTPTTVSAEGADEPAEG